MEYTTQLRTDRVRQNTSQRVNQKIDQQTNDNIRKYSSEGPTMIESRINQLNKEWDIERALELATATNTLLGLTLGLTVNKRWFILTAVTAAFLIQHTIQGWCPPIPILRRFGIRTKEEIDYERDALQRVNEV